MPRPQKKKPMTRLLFEKIHLRVSDDARARLERLQAETDADSMSEVMRRSLALYEVLKNEQKEGGEVVVRYPDGRERELILI